MFPFSAVISQIGNIPRLLWGTDAITLRSAIAYSGLSLGSGKGVEKWKQKIKINLPAHPHTHFILASSKRTLS
jgi:hypothetical protein